jgi:hypothetical protein
MRIYKETLLAEEVYNINFKGSEVGVMKSYKKVDNI